jgi:ABC-2 type transport system permease protein
MSTGPKWNDAIQRGLRGGRIEFGHPFTTGQDLFGRIFWSVILLSSLFLLRDNPIEGATVSWSTRLSRCPAR